MKGADVRRVTHHSVSAEDHTHYPLTLFVGAPEYQTRSLELEVPVKVDADPLEVRLSPFDPNAATPGVMPPDDCAADGGGPPGADGASNGRGGFPAQARAAKQAP